MVTGGHAANESRRRSCGHVQRAIPIQVASYTKFEQHLEEYHQCQRLSAPEEAPDRHIAPNLAYSVDKFRPMKCLTTREPLNCS